MRLIITVYGHDIEIKLADGTSPLAIHNYLADACLGFNTIINIGNIHIVSLHIDAWRILDATGKIL